MSTEKSEKKLKKEAGALIAKMEKNLERLTKSLGEGYRIGGKDSLVELKKQLEQFERWQKNPQLDASMYSEALEKLYKTVNQAMRNPDFKESRSSFARSTKQTSPLPQQPLNVENEQVSKQESEAKEVEAEQVAKVDDSDDDVIILPREKNDAVEQQEVESSDDDVIFLDPKTGEELKAESNDLTSGQKTQIREDDVEEEQIENEIETDANMQEKLAAIERTKTKAEAVMKGENVPQPDESKEHNDESQQTEEENDEALLGRLKAVQAGQTRNEALMSGVKNIDEFTEMTKKTEEIQALRSQPGATEPELEQKEVESEDVIEKAKSNKGKEEIGSEEKAAPEITVEAIQKVNTESEKKSQSTEFADFKEFATSSLKEMGEEGYANEYLNRIENALVSGNVQDNENRYTQAKTLLNDAATTKNDFNRGGKLRDFTEALKTIAREIQSPSHTETKSNVTQSFVSIINKADNIVTAGARVQDQIADLRRDINVIKSQSDFKQYQRERAEEKSERLENALVEAGISNKKTQEPANKSSEKKLDPDQKAAYQAISKLDKLLERVERSKVGIVKSILKGQVRKHLEAMNANPLKESIQKVGGLKTEKTEEAKTTPRRQ